MSNYIAHSTMGEITKIPNDKILISKSNLRVFSLGQDLVSLIKNASFESHNKNTALFFYNLINYIKDNNLLEDSTIMAYLYGNIMHYELDKHTHPYVYYFTNDVPKTGLVSFHMAAEEYLGDQILKEKLDITRPTFIKQTHNIDLSNETLKKMIDEIYEKTYGYNQAFSDIKKLLLAFKFLNNYRSTLDIMGKNTYFNFLGLKKYLETSKLSLNDLTNREHKEWRNPIAANKSQKSFTELFDEAINSSQNIMEDIDKVIYDGKSISTLSSFLDNKSYDTALPCEIGKPFNYSHYKKLTRTR